jgi:hypothetical protein
MKIVNRPAHSIATATEISSNRFDRASRLPSLTDAGWSLLSLNGRVFAAIDRDRIVPIFIMLAVGLRILFWAYTDRIWEDAIITLAPAKNFWEGYGLTHHIPEPRIYSFTSTISILVFLIGEPFGQAVNLMRVLSLFTAAGSIYFAARIMRHFGIHWLGQVVCLSYLATDHLQIFFGMAGMETQIATCIALGAIFFCLVGQPTWFGVFAGLALLARPEMLALAGIGFLYVLYKHRWAVWKPAVMTPAIVGPWIAFTIFYYGSPIPQTIVVKSWLTGQPSFDQILEYIANLWKQFAPFWEYLFVVDIPVPRFLPALVTGLTALCALLGLICVRVERLKLFVIAAVVFAFTAYLIRYTVNPYFMWYTPPFVALYFIIVAAGVSAIRRASVILASCVTAIITVAYAIPFVYALPLDRTIQKDSEVAVRTEVGRQLDQLMGKQDSVFLEPLGFIGLAVRDRMIYDNPGLGSKLAFEAVQKFGWGFGAVKLLKPSFIVFRPWELYNLRRDMPDVVAHYEEVAHIHGKHDYLINNRGLVYAVPDNEFYIFRRK